MYELKQMQIHIFGIFVIALTEHQTDHLGPLRKKRLPQIRPGNLPCFSVAGLKLGPSHFLLEIFLISFSLGKLLAFVFLGLSPPP